MIKYGRLFISLVLSGPVWLMTWDVNGFLCKCGSFLTWTIQSHIFGVLGYSSYLNQGLQWFFLFEKKEEQTKKRKHKEVLTNDFYNVILWETSKYSKVFSLTFEKLLLEQIFREFLFPLGKCGSTGDENSMLVNRP